MHSHFKPLPTSHWLKQGTSLCPLWGSSEGMDMGPFLLSVTLPTLNWSDILDITSEPCIENDSEPALAQQEECSN